MRLLCPILQFNSRPLIEAAQASKHEVICLLIAPNPQRERLLAEFKNLKIIKGHSRFDLKINLTKYRTYLTEFYFQVILENKISAILPVSSTDAYLNIIGKLNDELSLPGITESEALLFSNKFEYTKRFNDLNIQTPKIYECFSDLDFYPHSRNIKFPCLCKPIHGNGGYGVCIIQNPTQLNWFFSAETDDNMFSELTRFNQPRLPNGQLRNYLYHSSGQGYLIQEFLDGPTISVAGNFHCDGFTIDMIYDIDVNSPPYRSEVGFSFPSIYYEEIYEDIKDIVSKIRAGLNVPFGPFMIDFILTTRGLALIDFSPRMSSSAVELLRYSLGKNTYAENSIKALLGEPVTPSIPREPVCFKYFNFPEGRVNYIDLPPEAEQARDLFMPLKPGDELYAPRNDTQVATRGYIVFTGENCKNKVNDIFEKIHYQIDPF